MDISQLSAKQKRIQTFKEFLQNKSVSDEIREKVTTLLEVYGNILVESWKRGEVTQDAEYQMRDCERELEMLNDDIRLECAETRSRAFDK